MLAGAPNAIQTSICRVYLADGSTCTGFFVGWNYVATAGHCVSNHESGAYSIPYDEYGTFGNVCCRTRYGTVGYNCEPEYSFAIIGMITTCGWLNLRQRTNDGAVLLVRKLVPVVPPGFLYTGEPLPFSQIFKPPGPGESCPTEVFSSIYSGYPGSFAIRREGCFQAFEERLFQPLPYAPLLYCSPADLVDFGSLAYNGSSCPGMSGGPLYKNKVFGILVASSITCQRGSYPNSVEFSAISNSSTSWGVCMSCLVDALAASLPPSPPPYPPLPPPTPPSSPAPPPLSAGGSTPPSPSFSQGDLLGKKHLPNLLDDLLP